MHALLVFGDEVVEIAVKRGGDGGVQFLAALLPGIGTDVFGGCADHLLCQFFRLVLPRVTLLVRRRSPYEGRRGVSRCVVANHRCNRVNHWCDRCCACPTCSVRARFSNLKLTSLACT